MKFSLTSYQCSLTCFVVLKSLTFNKNLKHFLHQMPSSFRLCQRLELAFFRTKTGKKLLMNKDRLSSHRIRHKRKLI